MRFLSLLLIISNIVTPLSLRASESLSDSHDINLNWPKFESSMALKQNKDYIDGLSYIISGSIALVGGFVGQGITQDPLEKGVYTLFQTIGIASIGYGAYSWKLGDEDRFFYDSVKNASLTAVDRNAILRSYYLQKKVRERNERFIKAVTHSLIAAVNIYNASQQNKSSVQNGLYFIGGVNLLAAISFSF